jgi:hypothetical protein
MKPARCCAGCQRLTAHKECGSVSYMAQTRSQAATCAAGHVCLTSRIHVQHGRALLARASLLLTCIVCTSLLLSRRSSLTRALTYSPMDSSVACSATSLLTPGCTQHVCFLADLPVGMTSCRLCFAAKYSSCMRRSLTYGLTASVACIVHALVAGYGQQRRSNISAVPAQRQSRTLVQLSHAAQRG